MQSPGRDGNGAGAGTEPWAVKTSRARQDRAGEYCLGTLQEAGNHVAPLSGCSPPAQPGQTVRRRGFYPWLCLLATRRVPHALAMFVVTEADTAAIRAAFYEEGELSAVIELRQRFPGVDHAKARACARTIAGWTLPPAIPCPMVPLRPGKDR